MSRKTYPSDVTDDEWAFAAPYLTLMKENAPQREHSLPEVFNALRCMVRTGVQWRFLPNDLPPVGDQTQLRLDGPFSPMARDYERLAETLAGFHFIAFAVLLAKRFVEFMTPCA